MSSGGTLEFGVTRSDTPSSSARRWASGRSPTTMTSPARWGPAKKPIAIVLTQIRPVILVLAGSHLAFEDVDDPR